MSFEHHSRRYLRSRQTSFIQRPYSLLTMRFVVQLSAFATIFLAVTPSIKAGLLSGVLDFTAPKKNIEIKNWHVEKCEENGREDHLVLKNAVVYTKDNGDLGLSGYVNSSIFLHSPFKVRVTMKKKTLGLWVKLPCIKDFGSCTYDDLCEYGYSYHTPCPNSFARDHVPCRCPIDKGAYSIPEDVHVPMKSTRWAGIAKGDYRAKVHFIHDEKEIACYIALFTLKSAKD